MRASAGEIARARSALEAAQSDLHTVQMKLAPLRAQERRALARLADAARHLRVLEGGDAARPLPTDTVGAIVALARLYEGRPCDTEGV